MSNKAKNDHHFFTWIQKDIYYIESLEKFPIKNLYNGKMIKSGYKVATFIISGEKVYQSYTPIGERIYKSKRQSLCKKKCEEHHKNYLEQLEK